MDAIIQQALQQLKGRVKEIAREFEREGLNPRSLSNFEHRLHESLGELGRRVETAVLEGARSTSASLAKSRCVAPYTRPTENARCVRWR